ncbi:MAG: DinB family protein [Candidatus Dormibacteraceae bacterium]
MTSPGTRRELSERIERGWAELDRMLDGLSDEQLAAPGRDGWAIKDHVAHLAAWERSTVALLEGRDRQAAMGLAGGREHERGSEIEHEVEELNERLFALHRDLGPAGARALLSATHDELRAALAQLDDADLQAPYARFQPGDADEVRPVVGWIAGNTYEHVEEHQPWITEIMGRRS